MSFLLSLMIVCQPLSYTFNAHFDKTATEFSNYGEYTLISAEGADMFGRTFEPVLPAKHLQILLPYDASLLSVRCEGENLTIAGTAVTPLPAVLPAPLGTRRNVVFLCDPAVYESQDVYPDKILQWHHFGNQSGFKIASVFLTPYQWNPVTKEVSVYEDVSVTVEYERTGEIHFNTPLGDYLHRSIIGFIVCNPEALASSAPPVTEGNADYLIIAPLSLLNTPAMDSLLTLRTLKGLVCDTASKERISATVTGYDLPEKIRNYIIQRHSEDGVSFILLVGNRNLLQPRELFISCRDTNGVFYDDSAPVDLYFADLDGDWNFTADNRYGQPNDSLDLYADVFVGRLVVGSSSELSVNVRKICEYEQNPPQGDWRTKSLLAGAVLFDNQYYTITGEAVCESIADHLPQGWHHIKMYETLYGNSPEGAIDSVNDGVAWTHWAGHGNRSGVYWYNSYYIRMLHVNDIANMTNGGKLAVHTSIACMSGAYHEGNCAAVALLNKEGGGGIVSAFNTSYGWEGILPAMGPSEYMDIWFAEAVFDSSIFSLGPAFYASKSKLIPFWDINYYGGYDRNLYTLLDRTYFGDPALCFLGSSSFAEEEISEPTNGSIATLFISDNYLIVESDNLSSVRIFDISGRIVTSGDFEGRFVYDMNLQPSGIYFCVVISGNQSMTERMVYVK
ncbi:T9SS type A sorting domain-containing protein [candidate division WOR-3 bacterium]|nr:T9SS type A sorting domain-containing protein [candidate division WOR-3 bacterium]